MADLSEFLLNFVDTQINLMHDFDRIQSWLFYEIFSVLVNHGYDSMVVNSAIWSIFHYVLTCKELWKSLAFLGHPNYEISTCGRIRNITNENITFGTRTIQGYFIFRFNNSRGREDFRMHHLVAMTFISNPENKETVDHIDRNTENNHVLNLRWATQAEQASNRHKPLSSNTGRPVYQLNLDGTVVKLWNSIKEAYDGTKILDTNISHCCGGKRKTAGGFLWRYYEDMEPAISDEIWRQLPVDEHRVFLVSNYGRVKNESGRILKGSKSASGYFVINITQSLQIGTHRLIAHVFLGLDLSTDLVVNHKNGVKTDNRLENLEIMTHMENINHAIKTGLRSTLKVNQYTLDGQFLATFENAREASIATGARQGSIYRVCNGKRNKAGNFKWKYAD